MNYHNNWDSVPTEEYYKAVQARADRARAYVRATSEKQGIRYTTKGDFSHLARKGVSFARG
ncbi:hypothetical protein Stuart_6 [Providencia phage vB_PstP_PS3]|uniref:Uncharacterized protein n=1 Tax=Providencia phage vB_PstP_PS3 TaxID=2848038 RepID=A0A411AWF3_9CAUD|nr:hypothetical protein HOV05_gp06 [Providencia phage vB_PstP_PS3]QAX92428.1 hypothetical protein Stuart_6 [Providencia phage vB_PstP_PS3]